MFQKATEILDPITWLPESLKTRLFHGGFHRDNELPDGTENNMQLIEWLAMEDISFIDKIHTLYASGVTDHEGTIFSPKQIVAMMAHRNPYKPNDVCHWISGIRTDDGIVYGPDIHHKLILLSELAEALDLWQPADFQKHRNRISDYGESSEYEQSIYLIANYAQLIFLLIHPYWNRNGRTSEEIMHLFSLQNEARPLVLFGTGYERVTDGTLSRMKIINRQAKEILGHLLSEIGVSINPEQSTTDGYRSFFINRAGTRSGQILPRFISPYNFRFICAKTSHEASELYFEHLYNKLSEMIGLLHPDNFQKLMNNQHAQELFLHQLRFGRYQEK